MDNYNSTKDPLLDTQTHLKIHIWGCLKVGTSEREPTGEGQGKDRDGAAECRSAPTTAPESMVAGDGGWGSGCSPNNSLQHRGAEVVSLPEKVSPFPPLPIAAELGRGGWEALNKIAELTAITGREVEL